MKINLDSFSNISNPVYSSATGDRIDLTCDIDGIGTGLVFTAAADDVMNYGRKLYQNAASGDYGEIAPYAAPEIPANADLLQARQKTVSELSLEAFALQCAVDAGTASQEQIETLAALKQNIAERIGENNEVNK